MKQIRIDFVMERGWRWIWAAAAVAVLCIAGLVGWQVQKSMKTFRGIEDQIAITKEKMPIPGPPPLPVVDLKHASSEQAAKLLQQDLNKVFSSAENLKEPGVRLRSLTLDNLSSTVRLEFELDALPKASSLTDALNVGYEDRPWQIESVNGAGSNIASGFATTQTFRGLWFAQLDKL
jgi:hypothetical protein